MATHMEHNTNNENNTNNINNNSGGQSFMPPAPRPRTAGAEPAEAAPRSTSSRRRNRRRGGRSRRNNTHEFDLLGDIVRDLMAVGYTRAEAEAATGGMDMTETDPNRLMDRIEADMACEEEDFRARRAVEDAEEEAMQERRAGLLAEAMEAFAEVEGLVDLLDLVDEDEAQEAFDDMGEMRENPAPKAALRALNECKVEVAADCAVCKEGLVVGSMATALPCGHMFHTGCIKPWLERQRTCPTCRADITAPPAAPVHAAAEPADPVPEQPITAPEEPVMSAAEEPVVSAEMNEEARLTEASVRAAEAAEREERAELRRQQSFEFRQALAADQKKEAEEKAAAEEAAQEPVAPAVEEPVASIDDGNETNTESHEARMERLRAEFKAERAAAKEAKMAATTEVNAKDEAVHTASTEAVSPSPRSLLGGIQAGIMPGVRRRSIDNGASKAPVAPSPENHQAEVFGGSQSTITWGYGNADPSTRENPWKGL